MRRTDSFGEERIEQLDITDVVTWKRLGEEKNIGRIYELYTVELGGRQVKKAKVASFKDAQNYDVLVLELKLLSKGKQ